MSGTIEAIAVLGSVEQRSMVMGLSEQLGLPFSLDVSQVFVQSEAQHELYRQSRRPSRRNRGSRRRDLRVEILDQWPELEASDDWLKLSWLQGEQGEAFLEKLRLLPNFQPFQQSIEDRARIKLNSTNAELKEVLFRRLIHSLETILYARNLPLVASPVQLEKYRKMIAIEEMSFDR